VGSETQTALRRGLPLPLPCRCRARSAELAWHNHPINGVGRGYIETDLNTALMNDKAFSSWVEASTLAGHWSKVDEIVGSCIFRSNLVSEYGDGGIRRSRSATQERGIVGQLPHPAPQGPPLPAAPRLPTPIPPAPGPLR
jgi:hypothetical protein